VAVPVALEGDVPQVELGPRRPGPSGRPGLRAAALLTVGFLVIAALVVRRWSVLTAFDRNVLVDLNHVDRRSAGYVAVMRAVSDIGGGTGWSVILTVGTAALLVHQQWRQAAFVAVTGVGGSVLNAVAKDVVHRPRPELRPPIDVVGGWSFPSGHTQSATVGCAVLLIVSWPRLGPTARRVGVVTAVVIVAVVGLSRMSLGVHYPSDVTAAVLLGLAWAFTLARLMLGSTAPHRTGPPADRHRRMPVWPSE
jgi:membrane-associated phospholipid phosphatase